MADIFDEIAQAGKVREFGYDFTAVDIDNVAAKFREYSAQRTCQRCRHDFGCPIQEAAYKAGRYPGSHAFTCWSFDLRVQPAPETP